MSYVIIQSGGGVITYRNIDIEKHNLPDDCEIFDSIEDFQQRLAELNDSTK